MSSPSDLTPLVLERSGNHLRFLLTPQEDILPELPADYEKVLEQKMVDILAEAEQLTAEIDLTGVAAISSRELGSLIALQRVLKPHIDRIPVRGISKSVRHLLELTRTDQLFDVQP